MTYVEQTLIGGEHIRHTGYFHILEKLLAVIFCFFIIGIIWVLRLWTTEMAITNRRLVYKRGIIARHTEEMSLLKVEEVNLKQSVLGRIFGFGKVQVQGTGGSFVKFPTMGSPMKFRTELLEARAGAEKANIR